MRKTLSILLSAILVITSFVPMTFAEPPVVEAYGDLDITATQSYNVTIPSLSQGEIWAGKDVQYSGNGEFTVSLLAGGKNFIIETPLPREQYDIVFVLDRSGSMRDGSRMSDLKTAATGAVNAFLDVPGSRVAIVSYSDDSTTNIGFTGISGKASVISAINGLSANGGTNIQNAILRTENLLNSRSTQEKERKSIVILMSDGEPTYYHTSLSSHTSGNREGNGITTTKEHVWYTVLQANRLKANVNNLEIFTIGFAVDTDLAKATLMPDTNNTATIRPYNIYANTFTESAKYLQQRTRRNSNASWGSWSLVNPLVIIDDTVSNIETLHATNFTNSVPTNTTWSSPNITGPYTSPVTNVNTQTRYATGTRTRADYRSEQVAFNHKYWSEKSTFVSSEISELIKAFTEIINESTNVPPHQLSEEGPLSDIIITDVVGPEFEITNRDALNLIPGVTVVGNTITWIIPGSELYTIAANGNTSLNPDLLNKLVINVKVNETEGTHLTNASANVSFTVDSENNPAYNTNAQESPIPGTGSITLVQAMGIINEYHVFTDDSSKNITRHHSEVLGTDITFEAEPHAGYTMAVDNSTTLTTSRIVQTITFTYTPIPRYDLTVEVIGQGSTSPAVGTHSYEEGTVVSLTATPAEGWRFVGWSENVSGSSVTMDESKTVVATFELIPPTMVDLTVEVVGQGSTSPAVGTHSYEEGTVVSLTATPAEGWRFVGWSENVSGSSVTMDESKTVVATFELIPPTMVDLTVEVVGQGSTSPAVGTHSYEEGTVVSLTATPAEGWRFVGWSENVSGSSVTMDESKTVVATFELIPPNMVVLTVEVVGQGSTSPAVGSHTYEEGTLVPLTATPAEGWRFVGWSENVSGSSVTMNESKTVVATFELIPPTMVNLTVEVIGQGSTSPAVGTHSYEQGTLVPLTATPAEGWRFVGWSENVSGSSVTMNESKTVVATFELIPPTMVNLTVEVIGQGSTSPAVGTHSYEQGTLVPLTATPAEGWRFVGWSENVSGSSVTMNESKTVVATFELIPPTMVNLTVEVIGQGSTSPAVGTHSYEQGTLVPLTATPAEGWRFVGWSENVSGSSVTMDESKTVVATFELLEEEPPIIIPPVTPDPPVPTPDPVSLSGIVVVNYTDTFGNSLFASSQISGAVGTNYTTLALSFDGYTLVSTPSNATGSFIDGTITVDYIYSDGTEIIIEEEEPTPLGPAIDLSTEEEEEPVLDEPAEEIILLDEELPLGDALPLTGHLPTELFFGLGSIITAAGVYLKRK